MKFGRLVVVGTLPLILCLHGLAQDHIAQIEQARTVLREGGDSGDATVRVEAIRAAGLIGPNEVLRHRIEQNLEDGNVDVRIAAIKTLADLKSVASIPAIQKRLKEDKTPEVNFAAAKALYALHDPAGQTWLLGVYNGTEKASSDALHAQTRKFLGNFHSLESAGTFIVSSGIGYVPVPGVGEGFAAVTGLLSDPDLSPRAAALLLLTRDRNDQTDAMLREALKDKDWSVRASAAQMIAYTARAGMSEDLVPLFTDKTTKVRFRAAGAYLHLAIFAKNATPAGN